MAQKTFMGFTFDSSNSFMGGGQEGCPGVDLGFGVGNPAPIKLVQDIYRLEYVMSGVSNRIQAFKRQGRDVPVRVEVRLVDLKSSLEKALDAENARLAFAMHLRSQWQIGPQLEKIERNKKDLALVGDIEELTEKAITTGKLLNGKHVPSTIFVGAVLPNKKKINGTHIKHLDAAGFGNVWNWVHRMAPVEADMRIRNFIRSEYLEPEFDKMMQRFIDAIRNVQDAVTLEQKLVAFHFALTVAHGTTFIANNLYGMGSVQSLDRLSAMHDPSWDVEIDGIMK